MPRAPLTTVVFLTTAAICFAAGEDPTNLITNPSFEGEVAQHRLPRGWRPYFDTDKGYHYAVVDGGHTGKKSLMITGEGTRTLVFAEGVKLDRTKRYVLRGWVRYEGDNDGWAMINFNYRKGGTNYYIKGGDRISAGQKGWQFQSKTDRADEASEADMLWISCKLEGKGKAWFDDLELIAYDRKALPRDFDAKHGTSNRPAAWHVLQRRVGAWNTETTVKPGKWNPGGAKTTGKESTRWVLANKFIQAEGQKKETNARSIHLMTFDEQFNVYRMWFFTSNGHFPRSPFTGQWNETAQTLTFKATDPEGIKVTSIMKFVDDDHMTWHGVWTKDGEVTMEMDSKATRADPRGAKGT
jgi:hypothetical protein